MDADPWADAPPSPRPDSLQSTPTKISTQQSPLTHQAAAFNEAPQPVASTSSPSSPHIAPAAAVEEDGFDDFDEFDVPSASAAPVLADDDGVGDFGDFAEGDFGETQADQGEDVPVGDVFKEPERVEDRLVSWRKANRGAILVSLPAWLARHQPFRCPTDAVSTS